MYKMIQSAKRSLFPVKFMLNCFKSRNGINYIIFVAKHGAYRYMANKNGYIGNTNISIQHYTEYFLLAQIKQTQ